MCKTFLNFFNQNDIIKPVFGYSGFDEEDEWDDNEYNDDNSSDDNSSDDDNSFDDVETEDSTEMEINLPQQQKIHQAIELLMSNDNDIIYEEVLAEADCDIEKLLDEIIINVEGKLLLCETENDNDVKNHLLFKIHRARLFLRWVC